MSADELTGGADARAHGALRPVQRDIAWVCARHSSWRAPSRLGTLCARTLDFASRCTKRVVAWRWIRFRIDLRDAPSAPPDVRLTLIDDAVLAGLREHADAGDLACSSGLKFRELGMLDGFAWIAGGEPLCSMWLLTERDNAALAAMPEWADMYPPLTAGVGQVEKIWTYSNARQKGVATRFAYGLFDEARRRGLRTLTVHIADFNQPALLWAVRSGWSVSGTITRYHLDVPGIRRFLPTVAFHGADRGELRAVSRRA
jgi:hypothetical protein